MNIEALLQELEVTKSSLLNAQALLEADPENEEINNLYQEVLSLFNLQLEEIKTYESLIESNTETQSDNSDIQLEHKSKGLSRESSPVDTSDEIEKLSGDLEPDSYDLSYYQNFENNAASYGLGYNLLKKMGYKDGEGLGRNKQGITKPVEVTLWSNGESIDKLIKLRNKKDKKYKTIETKKKDQEIPLFSFLNNTLKTNNSIIHESSVDKNTNLISISSSSSKEKTYNVRLAQSSLALIQDKIVRLEKQINSLNTRQLHNSKSNPSVASELNRQAQPLIQQLNQLRSQERKETVKINSHKARSKMTEF